MLRQWFGLRRTWLVAIGVAALAGLLVTAGLVAAQTATPTPSAGSTNRCAAIGTKQGSRLDTLLTDLVNQGIINQSQADAIRNYLQRQAQSRCYQAAILPPADILSTAANKLGLTTSQLRAELRQGKSLAQVASDHGVSRDDLKNALLQTARTNANALVQQGVLTQEEAERAITDLQNNLDTLLDKTGMGGFWGHGWHRGFRHGWFKDWNREQQDQQGTSQSGARLVPSIRASRQ
ncbi:hypothetical protein NET03_01255 [Thermomicrobium sp. CFH 73360]|uniref:hypothetical protein n=1 Tax=Thermomicrobium sp. CFH 73360 TaxID=2951987 RepID=UPI002076B90E|nr:hypothetical protein [Thermomicrobium sp. CFH 73360]MCM8745152.1 hypothetical protein [Thermomicrobium sp. CFH 73360]